MTPMDTRPVLSKVDIQMALIRDHIANRHANRPARVAVNGQLIECPVCSLTMPLP